MKRSTSLRSRIIYRAASALLFLMVFNTPVFSIPPIDTFRAYGSASFALPGDDLFSSGFAGRAGISVPLMSGFAFPLEVSAHLGIDTLPAQDTGTVLALPLTAGIGTHRNIGRIWTASLVFGAGGYIAPVIDSPYETTVGGGPAVETYIDMRREILPSVSLGITGRWTWHIGTASVAAGGISFHYSRSPGGIRITPMDIGPLFPSLYAAYRTGGAGETVITNTGNFTIKVEEVSCIVPTYSNAPTVIPLSRTIPPGRSVQVPLRLELGDRVLGIVGDFPASCEITVSYRQGAGLKESSTRVPVQILDRNSIAWDDDAKACLFITEKDPSVRHFMGQVAGGTARHGKTLINQNFTIAVATLAAFEAYGLSYIRDPASPYSASHERGTIDFLRFPRETLADGIGDCDDLAVLYCALLESVGIETALVTVPGHIFAAVSLDMKYQGAVRQFASRADLLNIEGETWLPVETTITDDIIKSWRSAADQYRKAAAAGQAGFIRVREGWSTYPPVALPTIGSEAPDIDPDDFLHTIEQMRAGIVRSEMEPIARDLIARIDQGASKAGRVYNRLGILYARYGQLEEALEAFQSAVYEAYYEPAMVNLANILLLIGDYRDALDLFESYHVNHPEEPAAVLGISMARFRLGEYDTCAQAYEKLEELDPIAAAENSYLIVRTVEEIGPSRASVRAEEVLWVE
ncbi:MAG: hypothetical protein ACP5IA_03365 [Sediminispirochaetaceae bacterium]